MRLVRHPGAPVREEPGLRTAGQQDAGRVPGDERQPLADDHDLEQPVAQDLARLGPNRLGDLVGTLVDQPAQPLHGLDSLVQRALRPIGLRPPRRRHQAADLGGGHHRVVAQLRVGQGIAGYQPVAAQVRLRLAHVSTSLGRHSV